MLEHVIGRVDVVARLRASVLGADLDELADELQRLGYTLSTVQSHLRAAGHLAHWLGRQRIAVRSLNEAIVERFVERHLPHCRCSVARATAAQFTGVAPHLLRVLRDRDRIPLPRTAPPTPVEIILQAFREHLRTNRGATPGTCECHARQVRPLLERTYGARALDFARLTPRVLRGFVTERTAQHSTRAGRRAASALRTFLRFLHLQGLAHGQLVHAVPTVRDTRRSMLPVPLTATQLRQLLDAIDQTKAVGRRDYAMLMCLGQLGLRAHEVAALTLDDIDWRAGTVTIVSSKVRRVSTLPLPSRLGQAIVRYLRQGRPFTPARQVFVRHFFPVGRPLRSANVIGAVQRAFKRSGLDAPSRGAHTLRHTAATEMVRAGASLKAVADVLRHRSIDTAAIYTKIDVARLREVALPWPEVEP